MTGVRHIAVTPDMPDWELRAVWSSAVNEARHNPGRLVIIEFAPGTYSLPSSGALVYETGTVLHVSDPGYRITVMYLDRSGLSVETERRSA